MTKLVAAALLLFAQTTKAEWDGRGYYSDEVGTSMAWLFLGAIHAVPMVIIGAKTNSKVLTTFTACGMVWVALGIGTAAYAIVDLIFVGIGTWIGLKLTSADNKAASSFSTVTSTPPPDVEDESPESRRSELVSSLWYGSDEDRLTVGTLFLEGGKWQKEGRWKGIPFPQDIPRALVWLWAAKNGGSTDAATILGAYYIDVWEDSNFTDKEASRKLLEAGELLGRNPYSPSNLKFAFCRLALTLDATEDQLKIARHALDYLCDINHPGAQDLRRQHTP